MMIGFKDKLESEKKSLKRKHCDVKIDVKVKLKETKDENQFETDDYD